MAGAGPVQSIRTLLFKALPGGCAWQVACSGSHMTAWGCPLLGGPCCFRRRPPGLRLLMCKLGSAWMLGQCLPILASPPGLRLSPVEWPPRLVTTGSGAQVNLDRGGASWVHLTILPNPLNRCFLSTCNPHAARTQLCPTPNTRPPGSGFHLHTQLCPAPA